MGRRNWTRCPNCMRKLNRKKINKTSIEVCYPCHTKQLKKRKKESKNGTE
jgi:hypothetical protein